MKTFVFHGFGMQNALCFAAALPLMFLSSTTLRSSGQQRSIALLKDDVLVARHAKSMAAVGSFFLVDRVDRVSYFGLLVGPLKWTKIREVKCGSFFFDFGCSYFLNLRREGALCWDPF